MTESPDDIVGHKTFADGSHAPLRRAEAATIMAEVERREKARAETMPDVQSAIMALHEAFLRLKELGWREAQYCPKDGTAFEVIEAGSSGIHRCHYSGEWPKGTWWVEDGGDLWPSRPVLFRELRN